MNPNSEQANSSHLIEIKENTKLNKKKDILYAVLGCLFLTIVVIAVILIYKTTTKSHSSQQLSNNSQLAINSSYEDKFITALPVDLEQIVSISKFRSCSGHDYSSANVNGEEETNRSMKHYINPLDSLVGSINTIKIFAPFDGTVAAINADAKNNAQVGKQIWLTPTNNPTWSYIYYHITPTIKAGDNIKSGQLIGYANLSRTSVIDFDIALEAWPQNIHNPLGPGNLGDLDLALKRDPNYLELLHTGQLDSIFNHMDQKVLDQFAARGISPENIIVEKTDRDASLCPQPTNNGHYQSTPTDNIILK